MRARIVLLTVILAVSAASRASAAPPPADDAAPVPIVLDTDIGSDIDDAFALALILKSPELSLLGVTTVSGDTASRARLAARLLVESDRPDVPVAAGQGSKALPLAQGRWSDGFTGAQIGNQPVTEFVADLVKNWDDKTVTLVAIGPLTNVALMVRTPAIARKLKQIALMGGAVYHGYGTTLTPAAEYNIASDPKAAQVVFSSGIPIIMATLDVTAMLNLDAAARHRVFTQLTPLTNSLALLYHLWGGEDPVLFDAMAVAMVVDPALCQTQQLAIEVDAEGFTRVAQGKAPNATVGLHTEAKRFFDFYLARVAPQP